MISSPVYCGERLPTFLTRDAHALLSVCPSVRPSIRPSVAGSVSSESYLLSKSMFVFRSFLYFMIWFPCAPRLTHPNHIEYGLCRLVCSGRCAASARIGRVHLLPRYGDAASNSQVTLGNLALVLVSKGLTHDGWVLCPIHCQKVKRVN